MDTNPRSSSGILLSLALAASANAAVSFVGLDSTTGANWRTAANLETDNEYGSDGYVIFGLNEANSVYTQPFDVSSANTANAYSLPAGISVSTVDTNIGMWSGNGNFGTLQDPTADNSITSAPVLANSSGTRKFTITRATSDSLRITLLTASGDNEALEYTLTVNDGSGAMMSNYDHTENGVAYHVFDISDGTNDIVIDIASVAQNRSLTGIAFDALQAPEPSSVLLLSLSMIGPSMRRRR